jgi:ferritin-like metal-binding protein YciE
MGLFTSEEFNSLEDLLRHEVKDLYDAEHQIIQALPQMAEKANNSRLKRAFEDHLRQSEKHVQRLESVFEHLGIEPEREKCHGIAGLIKEGSNILSATGDADVIDAGLIAAAQRVEHYEIAAYGTVRAFAQQLNNEYAAELFEQTLEEEKSTDQLLTEIAEGSVNPASA